MKNRTELALYFYRFLGALLLLCAAALAQSNGTVTVQTSSILIAAAGAGPTAAQCTFTSNGTTIQSACSGAGATMGATVPLPVPMPGTAGAFTISGNSITWSFAPPGSTANGGCPSNTVGTCWQIVANGSTRSGVF